MQKTIVCIPLALVEYLICIIIVNLVLRALSHFEHVLVEITVKYTSRNVGGAVASWLARSTPERALRV